MRHLIPLLLLTSCAKAPPVPAAPPEEAPVTTWNLQDRMQEHFAHATDTVYYVIAGRPAEARAEAKALAELPQPPDLPTTWNEGFAALQLAAAEVAATEDSGSLAHSAAKLGATCAGCHIDTGGGPKVLADEILSAGWDKDSEMGRHELASYLMWTGLVAPSNEVYAQGIGYLGEAEDHKTLEDETHRPLPPELAVLELQVHDLAERGLVAQTAQERTEAYGEFLSTCAACHGLLGVKIGQP